MIWVEHDMQLVGDLADEIVVLDFGTKIAEGKPDQVLNDPNVVRSYLGRKAESPFTLSFIPRGEGKGEGGFGLEDSDL
jgi:energy-coupling factor transporter ATP-binding protein EcfA2